MIKTTITLGHYQYGRTKINMQTYL